MKKVGGAIVDAVTDGGGGGGGGGGGSCQPTTGPINVTVNGGSVRDVNVTVNCGTPQ